MARIVGVDYGKKRCGISATDTLQIAVHPVITVDTTEVLNYLHDYIRKEDVESIVFGWPTHADGKPMPLSKDIKKISQKIHNKFPQLKVDFQEEDFTSQQAAEILFHTSSKKARRDKKKLDLISAVLILQRYLKHI